MRAGAELDNFGQEELKWCWWSGTGQGWKKDRTRMGQGQDRMMGWDKNGKDMELDNLSEKCF